MEASTIEAPAPTPGGLPRSPNTTKHDFARLLHVYADPRFANTWTEVYSPVQERELLDADHLANDISGGWTRLIEAFNDYEGNNYQNLTIKYINVNGVPVRVNPWQSRNDNLSDMATRCWELEPTDLDRPQRDVSWIRDKMSEIRKEVTKINSKYHQSGQMEAENCNVEWLKFCSNSFDWVAYAFCVLVDGSMDQLGKEKPRDAQKDTGALGDRSSRTPADSDSGRKRRRNRKDSLTSSEGSGGAEKGKASNNINDVISSGMAANTTLQALQYLVANDCQAVKDQALEKIRKLAGLVNPVQRVERRIVDPGDDNDDDDDDDDEVYDRTSI